MRSHLSLTYFLFHKKHIQGYKVCEKDKRLQNKSDL